MTNPIIETIARAMQESDAWPVVFAPGSAESLARSAIAALEANGLAVVPAEPTEAMIAAGDAIELMPVPDFDPTLELADAPGIYRAMIQAGKAKG